VWVRRGRRPESGATDEELPGQRSHADVDAAEPGAGERHGDSGALERGVVLVVHEAPAYRRGVAAGLREAGFDVREASRLSAADNHWDVCLLAVGPAPNHETIAATGAPGRPTVALLASPKPADYQLALLGGAAGAVAQDADVRQILDVIDAALRDETLLPIEIARALAEGSVAIPDTIEISDQVAEWLRALSKGVPIATIARNSGYSERQMYRQMQQLYRRIGARNRGEAICMAAKWGINLERSGRSPGSSP
jgi:DNA-binding NarL/FixJ family response regulator